MNMPVTANEKPCLQNLEFKGFIEGLDLTDKSTGKPLCKYFGGVPYAQPPVEEYRWARPRELAPCYRYGTRADPGVFDGKTSVCPQIGASVNTTDENCLQCNVWVPIGERPAEGWPVYFYIREVVASTQFHTANMHRWWLLAVWPRQSG